MPGWIKLHRRFLEWEWYGSEGMVRLFVTLLLLANHEERQWRGLTIRRGQILTSRERLAKVTGLSEQTVRTCISRLKSTSEITSKSTNKFTLITISNYDRYQVCEDDCQPANQPAVQPADQPTNTQEDNYNLERELISAPAPAYEETTPSANWRHVSSVRRAILGNNRDKIAAYKRELFRDEAVRLAQRVGMNSRQVEAFVRWWTESTPGSDTLKAELQPTFDIESRMRNWMERERPAGTTTAQQPQSRFDKLQDDLDFVHRFFNQQSDDNGNYTSTPDEQ